MRKAMAMVVVALVCSAFVVSSAQAGDVELQPFTMDLSLGYGQVMARSSLYAEPGLADATFDFPVTSGTREVAMTLLQYGRDMFGGQVLKDMERRGYRPITFQELLWLHIAAPDLQLEHPIFALGTIVEILTIPRVAVLTTYKKKNRLLRTEIAIQTNPYMAWSRKTRYGAVRIR